MFIVSLIWIYSCLYVIKNRLIPNYDMILLTYDCSFSMLGPSCIKVDEKRIWMYYNDVEDNKQYALSLIFSVYGEQICPQPYTEISVWKSEQAYGPLMCRPINLSGLCVLWPTFFELYLRRYLRSDWFPDWEQRREIPLFTKKTVCWCSLLYFWQEQQPDGRSKGKLWLNALNACVHALDLFLYTCNTWKTVLCAYTL